MGFMLLIGGILGGTVGVWLIKLLRALGQADFLSSITYVVMLGGIDPTFEELQKPPGRSSESDGDAPPIMQALQAILTAPNIDALQASIQQYAHLLLTLPRWNRLLDQRSPLRARATV